MVHEDVGTPPTYQFFYAGPLIRQVLPLKLEGSWDSTLPIAAPFLGYPRESSAFLETGLHCPVTRTPEACL